MERGPGDAGGHTGGGDYASVASTLYLCTASHRAAAGCVDCHLPRHGIAKWISKADNGYRHSKAFTLQDFPEPIVMIDSSRRILQRNCLDCHGDLIHQMAAGHPDAVECVHCHQTVGHGERVALGGPERREELTLNGDS